MKMQLTHAVSSAASLPVISVAHHSFLLRLGISLSIDRQMHRQVDIRAGRYIDDR
jgi:hypothetical protein